MGESVRVKRGCIGEKQIVGYLTGRCKACQESGEILYFTNNY